MSRAGTSRSPKWAQWLKDSNYALLFQAIRKWSSQVINKAHLGYQHLKWSLNLLHHDTCCGMCALLIEDPKSSPAPEIMGRCREPALTRSPL